MSPGWEQPPSHPPSSLSFSLPHGSEIIHPPTDRCCVGGRCQGARSVWCKRVCVPALCLHVSICAHERLSVHLRACTCRSRVSRAASFRLDAVHECVAFWRVYVHLSTCCHLSPSLPSGKQYRHTVRLSSRLSSPLQQRPAFSPSILYSPLPSPSRCLCSAYEHRRSVRKSWQWGTFPCFPPSASTSPPFSPTTRSPLPPVLLPSSPLHVTFPMSSSPFSRHLSLSASLLPLSIIFPPLCSSLLSLPPLIFFLVHNM